VCWQLYEKPDIIFGINRNIYDAFRKKPKTPAVAKDFEGNFALVWQDFRDTTSAIYSLFSRADGGSYQLDSRVNDANRKKPSENPVIVSGQGGNYLVAWTENKDDSISEIYAQLYQPGGIKIDKNFLICKDQPTSLKYALDAAMNFSGQVVVVWENWSGADTDIYGQRLDFNKGNPTLGGSFRINDDTGSATQRKPAVGLDSNGYFVVVWEDYRNGGDDPDIYTQLYNNEGIRINTNYRVNQDPGANIQKEPDVNFANNHIYYIWQDNRIPGQGFDVFARIDMSVPVSVAEPPQQIGVTTSFQLFQNFPNPFNPGTRIRYELSRPAKVTLRIFNISGQEIAVLVDKFQDAGLHIVPWEGLSSNGNLVPSGVYWCRLEMDHAVQIQKMVLVR
jgi:hypothetical protein